KLAATSDGGTLVQLSKERSELQDIVEAVHRLKAVVAEREALDELSGDPEMAALAEEGRDELGSRVEELTQEIRILLLPRDAADEKSAILEIRAGTGGDEAALFAGDLFRMYQRYAQLHGWRMQVLSESEGEAGGYKEIIAEV